MTITQVTVLNQSLADALENGQVKQEIQRLLDKGLIELDFEFTEDGEHNQTYNYKIDKVHCSFEYIQLPNNEHLIFQTGPHFQQVDKH